MQPDQALTTKKIKKISKLFRILFQIAFIMQPILLCVFGYNLLFNHFLGISQLNFTMIFFPPARHVIFPLSQSTQLYAFLLSTIPVIISELMLYFLIKLFYLYEKAEIFTLQSVQYIRYVGYALLIGQIINPFYQFTSGVILTWNNPPGQHYAEITFTGSNMATILVALLIILISWIMTEGYKLQEEQKYTV